MERSLTELLERAVAADVIDAAQADRIQALAAEHSVRRVSPMLEALGYLGAVLVLAGAMSLVAAWWPELPTWGRLAILGGASAALTLTGLAVGGESDPVRWRLRGVLLMGSSGALAGFTGVLALDLLGLSGAPVAVVVGSAVVVHSGALWGRRDRPAQHLASLGGLVALCVGTVLWLGGGNVAVGLAVWALGVAWLSASLRLLLPPRLVGATAGAAVVLAGAQVTAGGRSVLGFLFALTSAASLIAVGAFAGVFAVTLLGLLGAFVFLPATLTVLFGDTVGAPALMLVSGLAGLSLAVVLIRRRPAD